MTSHFTGYVLKTQLSGVILIFAILATSCSTLQSKTVKLDDRRSLKIQYLEEDGENVLEGPTRVLLQNGHMVEERHYQNGRLEGDYQSWYPNRIEKAVGSFEDGERTGVWTFYRPNGVAWAEGRYEGDRPVGTWVYWTPDGAEGATLEFAIDEVDPVPLYNSSLPTSVDDPDRPGRDLVKRDIRASVRRLEGEILFCYQKELEIWGIYHEDLTPSMTGRVILRWGIGPGGKVLWGYATEMTLDSPTLETCMIELLPRMHFSPIGKNNYSVIVYPFSFVVPK